MKRIISIALLLAMAFSMVVSAKEVKVVGFSDLEAEWSKWYINKCLEKGAMTGTTAPDENGIAKFSPKMNVSLGQFLAAITKLLCPELVKPQEAGQSWTLPYLLDRRSRWEMGVGRPWNSRRMRRSSSMNLRDLQMVK